MLGLRVKETTRNFRIIVSQQEDLEDCGSVQLHYNKDQIVALRTLVL
jgi:hypothetical protein